MVELQTDPTTLRLQKLEARVGTLAGLAVLCISALLLMAYASLPAFSQIRDMRLRTLDLVDDRGNIRMRLSVANEEVLIALLDSRQRSRLALRVHKDGTPGIALNDTRPKPRLTMAVHPDGGAGFWFFGLEPRPTATFQIYPDGTPELLLSDPSGKRLYRAP